jgi:hypothetical protein
MKRILITLLFLTIGTLSFAQFIPPQPAKPVKSVKPVKRTKQIKTVKKTELQEEPKIIPKVIPKEIINEGSYIIVFRGGQFASALSNYNIFIDGKKVCKLSNGKYLKYPVSPGKHEVEAKKAGVDIIKKQTFTSVISKRGENNYISCNIKTSLLREKLEMIEVVESSGSQYVSSLKEDNCQTEINENKNNH